MWPLPNSSSLYTFILPPLFVNTQFYEQERCDRVYSDNEFLLVMVRGAGQWVDL